MQYVVDLSKVSKGLKKRVPAHIRKKLYVWVDRVQRTGIAAAHRQSGLRAEELSGPWQGYSSIRLSLQWRVIYQTNEIDESVTIVTVERVSPHDYKKKH